MGQSIERGANPKLCCSGTYQFMMTRFLFAHVHYRNYTELYQMLAGGKSCCQAVVQRNRPLLWIGDLNVAAERIEPWPLRSLHHKNMCRQKIEV